MGYSAPRTPRDRRWKSCLVPLRSLRGLIGIGIWGYVRLSTGVAIVAAIQKTRDRAIHLFEGILGVAVGTLFFLYPDKPGQRSCSLLVFGPSPAQEPGRSQVKLRKAIADEWLLGLRGILSITLGAILILRPQFGQVTTT
jgi:uncharacterized membrane protein HdeD (DUF308 family)